MTVKLLNNFGYDDVRAISESLVEVDFLEDSPHSEFGIFCDSVKRFTENQMSYTVFRIFFQEDNWKNYLIWVNRR